MNDEMQAFVEQQAAKLTHGDIVALALRLPALRERFSRLDVMEYPQLAAQYEFLALIVEDCSQNLTCKVSVDCCRESAFALLYLETPRGLLPHDAPGLTSTADHAVVATVLHKHRDALRESPRGYLFSWAAETVDFDRMVLDRLHNRMSTFRLDGLSDIGWLQSGRAPALPAQRKQSSRPFQYQQVNA